MPVEFGEPSIPGQTFLKIQNPSEDEDYGNKAGGGGGTQSQQEVLQVLHRRLQRGRDRDWTGAAAVRYNNNLQLSAARWGGTAVTWPRAEKTFGGRVFCNFCRYRRESGIGFIRCFGVFLVLRHPLTPVTTQLHVYAVLQSLSSSGIKETAMWAWLDICGSGFALYCVLWIGTFLIIPPIYILLMHHKTHYKENMKTTLCSFLLKLYLHCKY